MKDFEKPHGYEINENGTMELKGRTEPVRLFALKFE
jgi:hypothetical protein